MPTGAFENSVFVNCPFDDDFDGLLQAILFCCARLGFVPRIAPENPDNATSRLTRIEELVRTSKFGIHDVSRCYASRVDFKLPAKTSPKEKVFSRLNMPFELGLDYGLKCSGVAPFDTKIILVLENSQYDSKRTLSDLAGWDIQFHNNDFLTIIRKVSDWLKRVGEDVEDIGPNRIVNDYFDFQEWSYETLLDRGYSKDDIEQYPSDRVLDNILAWVDEGMPVSAN